MIIVSRSENKILHTKSKEINSSNIERVRGKFGGGQDAALKYLLNLFNFNDDWVINIDDDAFVFDSQRILNLIEFMHENNYDYCGMPDGGIVNERRHNPIVPNAFFNIINVKNIKINRNEIYQTKFTDDLKQYIPSILKPDILYQWNTREQYYCLFFWLIKRYKCLFLNAYEHVDGMSTILQDHEGNDFLIHTWCARTYGVEPRQTERINQAYEWALHAKHNLKNSQ